jgi:hypothetical protein
MHVCMSLMAVQIELSTTKNPWSPGALEIKGTTSRTAW